MLHYSIAIFARWWVAQSASDWYVPRVMIGDKLFPFASSVSCLYRLQWFSSFHKAYTISKASPFTTTCWSPNSLQNSTTFQAAKALATVIRDVRLWENGPKPYISSSSSSSVTPQPQNGPRCRFCILKCIV